MKTDQLIYNASPTLSAFHRCNDFYRFLMGPVGSGKSTGSAWEVMIRAQKQKPNKDRLRRTRFAVIRNTYPQLRDTTIKTWEDWFPPKKYGNINKQTMSQVIRMDLPDKTTVETEILFRALDRPDDVRNVLSLELTGAWVNEVREMPKGIVDALGDRSGRFPSMKDGGCTWRGVFGDTNMPDDDHWLFKLAEQERPTGYRFFKQPGGLIEIDGKFYPNPKAENTSNLETNYYQTRIAGKDPAYIRVYYCAQYGFVSDGKPVIPEYVDAIHCAPEVLQPVPGLLIYVGLDFGLTPAAVFAQKLPIGRWQWFDELVTEDMGAVRFGELLGAKLRGEYTGYKFDIYGDPAGEARAQTDEKTPFDILRAQGIPAKPAPTNDFTLRREAVAGHMGRLAMDGKPGFLISPKCVVTRKGLAGGYKYRRIQVAGEERYEDKPYKNKYSHPCEAGQYLMIGAGEGAALIDVPLTKPKASTLRPSMGFGMM